MIDLIRTIKQIIKLKIKNKLTFDLKLYFDVLIPFIICIEVIQFMIKYELSLDKPIEEKIAITTLCLMLILYFSIFIYEIKGWIKRDLKYTKKEQLEHKKKEINNIINSIDKELEDDKI